MAEPADMIHIRDLRLRCLIGVYDRERRGKQDVTVQIALATDLRRAGASDDLADTVDYKALKGRVVEMAGRSSFRLLEALAQRIAEICLEDPGVRRARVTVEKPGALHRARTVAVEITRERSHG